MRQFNRQVRMDQRQLRFYAVCAICGKRQYGGRLPFLCRSQGLLPRLEQGQADPFRQKLYMQSRRKAVEQLVLRFNLCRGCGTWVCDECFACDQGDGLCHRCITALEREKSSKNEL